MTLEGVSFWPFYSINDLKSALGKLSPNKKIVSFQQILKVGENIKIDICKCPINVELVKKSSNRPGHLQMPFQIHLLLCGMAVRKYGSMYYNFSKLTTRYKYA